MLDRNVSNVGNSFWARTTDGLHFLLQIADDCIVFENYAAYYRTEQLGNNTCRLIIANATMQEAGVFDCFGGQSQFYRSLVTVFGEW